MKKAFLMFIMLGLFFSTDAQVTENPIVDKTQTTTAYISKVYLTPDITIVELDVAASYSLYSWTLISPRTRIEYINPQTGLLEKKQILRLANVYGRVLHMGKKYYSNNLPSYTYILVFPNLPEEVEKINLIEPGGWKWYGINITPRNDNEGKRVATTEEEIDRLITNSKDINAGIYEQLSSTESSHANYRLAFIQTDEGTFLIYVGSTNSVGIWKCGDVKAKLRPTASKTLYKADWFMADKTINSAVITFEGATMNILIDGDTSVYVKMSGSNSSDEENIYSEKWSGTGFALKNGYILTNYHVIEDANVIKIYGISGDFDNGIKATVVGSDKSNDLALLKISGDIPDSFNSIPYSFKSKLADVGEDVYVLGYPLTATMGEEVKLTNGIISAKTGFDGDVSQYQISAPVQPGNSGGPLIDYNGNVIGVVCAKHNGAENVSYAVKVSQVSNLIESVCDLSIMNTTNTLQGKSLKDQVKSVNKYVYIIKCSK